MGMTDADHHVGTLAAYMEEKGGAYKFLSMFWGHLVGRYQGIYGLSDRIYSILLEYWMSLLMTQEDISTTLSYLIWFSGVASGPPSVSCHSVFLGLYRWGVGVYRLFPNTQYRYNV